MVTTCSAIGCKERAKKGNKTTFHRFALKIVTLILNRNVANSLKLQISIETGVARKMGKSAETSKFQTNT